MSTANQLKSGWSAMRNSARQDKKARNMRAEALLAQREADPALDAKLTYLARIEKNTRKATSILNAIGIMLFLFFLILLFRGFLSVIA